MNSRKNLAREIIAEDEKREYAERSRERTIDGAPRRRPAAAACNDVRKYLFYYALMSLMSSCCLFYSKLAYQFQDIAHVAHARQNELPGNVARPKDQIADYDECGTHFHVPWSSSQPPRSVPSPPVPLAPWRFIATPASATRYTATFPDDTSSGTKARPARASWISRAVATTSGFPHGGRILAEGPPCASVGKLRDVVSSARPGCDALSKSWEDREHLPCWRNESFVCARFKSMAILLFISRRIRIRITSVPSALSLYANLFLLFLFSERNSLIIFFDIHFDKYA